MIEFTEVVKSYDQGNKALNGVTMQIEDGEFCFLVGPSGSGKSTIIKLITGELKPTSGTVHVNGYSLERIRKREIPYLRRTVGVVFQDFRLIDKMTVYENVAFALEVIEEKPESIRKRVLEVLDLVGLKHKARMFPRELSGGEQQRISVARSIVNMPKVVIADEPTGNLDPETSWEIMNLFERINASGTTILMATHNREIVNTMRHRVIAIEGGLIARDEAGGDYGYEG